MSLVPRPIERGFEASLQPIVDRLIAWRVNPNSLTTLGTLVLFGSGVAYGYGVARVGGALLLLSGVFDMLDGRVARGGNAASKFGAFYDSTLDRVGESALYTGIALFFAAGGVSKAVDRRRVARHYNEIHQASLIQGPGQQYKARTEHRATPKTTLYTYS